jgi:ketosteroid isomerase-like protein
MARIMATTANKQLLQNVFAELAKGNGRPLVEAMADDVAWTVSGSAKWARTYKGKRAVIDELLKPLNKRFATPYRATAKRILADGDCVVVESRGEVTTTDGKPYNNNYCFVFRLDGGKVREITEYMDTELVTAALGDLSA